MTQSMIDSMCAQEYSHLLAYGDPVHIDDKDATEWISTMDSIVCPVMTYGYYVTH